MTKSTAFLYKKYKIYSKISLKKWKIRTMVELQRESRDKLSSAIRIFISRRHIPWTKSDKWLSKGTEVIPLRQNWVKRMRLKLKNRRQITRIHIGNPRINSHKVLTGTTISNVFNNSRLWKPTINSTWPIRFIQRFSPSSRLSLLPNNWFLHRHRK